MFENEKCQQCGKKRSLVEFDLVLRINGKDYSFLPVYCETCFEIFRKNITREAKIKFINLK